MKKIICLIAAAAAAVSLSACKGKAPLSVSEKNVRMKIDEKYTIKIENGNDEKVTWSSGDETIAVISPDGTVTAVGNGITTVTAKNDDSYVHVGIIVGGNNDYTDENGNVVQVFDQYSDIEAIVVGIAAGGKNDVTVKRGDKFQLRAYTTPSDSTDKIVWQCADGSIARVDASGMMEAVGSGKTVVTAYAPNGVKGELVVRVK